ncbi:MAG TPA: thiamine phosphate synthase [Gemmatimonadales bacterium]|nr:thiamine phosphate synthase [Gemmatimonadales bacterium]
MAPNLADALRLMLVTDDTLLGDRDPLAACAAAVRGGVTSVQLRLKRATPRELVAVARRLVAALPVPVLVNDRPDVALAAGAAGVHLGPDDLSPALARRVLGPGAVIGASVGLAGEAVRGLEADYWGVGPWRASATKPDAGKALGEEGVRRILALAGGRPCVAVGGVRPEDGALLRALGCAGVAVAGGILGEDDVEGRARRFGERGAESGER